MEGLIQWGANSKNIYLISSSLRLLFNPLPTNIYTFILKIVWVDLEARKKCISRRGVWPNRIALGRGLRGIFEVSLDCDVCTRVTNEVRGLLRMNGRLRIAEYWKHDFTCRWQGLDFFSEGSVGFHSRLQFYLCVNVQTFISEQFRNFFWISLLLIPSEIKNPTAESCFFTVCVGLAMVHLIHWIQNMSGSQKQEASGLNCFVYYLSHCT